MIQQSPDSQQQRQFLTHARKLSAPKATLELSGGKRYSIANYTAAKHQQRTNLTVKLEVVVHDEAARDSERNVVIVLEGHQERVLQVLRRRAATFEAQQGRLSCGKLDRGCHHEIFVAAHMRSFHASAKGRQQETLEPLKSHNDRSQANLKAPQMNTGNTCED